MPLLFNLHIQYIYVQSYHVIIYTFLCILGSGTKQKCKTPKPKKIVKKSTQKQSKYNTMQCGKSNLNKHNYSSAT